MKMSDLLAIVHSPAGYKMEMRIAAFAEKHVLVRTGEMQAISLDEKEVRLVIDWLQCWLRERRNDDTAD
jgi:hypothetical protein